MIATDLLLDIASGKNGYTIGDPWRFSEFSLAAVVPILRKTKAKRIYRLPSEVGIALKVRDSGDISKLLILNESEFPVLLKAGSILAGATQSRALACSQVVMPGEKIEADCVCVYASKGIRGGQEVKYDSYSPSSVRETVYSGWDYTFGPSSGLGDGTQTANWSYTGGLQSNVWGSVKASSRRSADSFICLATAVADGAIGVSNVNVAEEDSTIVLDSIPSPTTTWRTPSDDLAGRLHESEDRFKAVLKNTPHPETQVGVCLLTTKGLESLESFEHKDSWSALRDSILGSDADKIADISDEDNAFEFKPDKAKSMIRKVLRAKYEESVTVDKPDTKTYLLQSEKLTGEVVLLKSQPIHCTFVKKA